MSVDAQRLKVVFDIAVDTEPPERAKYLDLACAGEPSLRAEVESLLAAYEQSEDFLETPAFKLSSCWLPEDTSPSPLPERFGPYRVVREIGEGGMSTVYLAERDDEQYRKQVAIKLIKRGMDTDDLIRRFRSERQILAGLVHPNIARLLEGGNTEAGLPYFVMDHVDGIAINEYCERRNLSIQDRLELFLSVCSAVHYAHQNLVVHRDIKPGNILVTEEGVPKLLDFGIAKLLDPEQTDLVAPTRTAVRLMTPEYASPEQVKGETITTASDVYLLGVLLYELLTGQRPYRLKTRLPQEIFQVICEESPERPSTVVRRAGATPETTGSIALPSQGQRDKWRRTLAGDLDNIVLKAMQKEPKRRYASVEQLAEDIRRHLDGRPVTARTDTFTYRSSKFVKRNKGGVIAAGLVALTLIGGIITTTREARISERRFNDVRELANAYLFELDDAIKSLPGSLKARELLVKRALKYLGSLAKESDNNRQLQQELATAYQKVGDIQGNPYFDNVGDMAGALKSYRQALTIRAKLLSKEPQSLELRREVAMSHDRLGNVLVQAGETSKARESYQKAIEIRRQLLRQRPELKTRFELATSLNYLGNVQSETGDTEAALRSHRTALAISQALATENPGDTEIQRLLRISYNKIGNLLREGNTKLALENYQQGLKIALKLFAKSPLDPRVQRDLMITYQYVGDVLGNPSSPNLGATTAALNSYYKTLAIAQKLATTNRENIQAQRDLANIYERLGDIYMKKGSIVAALKSYRQGLSIRSSISIADESNAEVRRELATSYEEVGDALLKSKDLIPALENYRKGLSLREALLIDDPFNATVRGDVANSYSTLGEIHMLLALDPRTLSVNRFKQWLEARSWYQRSLVTWSAMQAHGTSVRTDASELEKLKRALARCDAAIKKLQN